MTFVVVNNSKLSKFGIGKFVALSSDDKTMGIVEYFDNPLDSRIEYEVPVQEISTTSIPLGTRIIHYNNSDNSWFPL